MKKAPMLILIFESTTFRPELLLISRLHFLTVVAAHEQSVSPFSLSLVAIFVGDRSLAELLMLASAPNISWLSQSL